MSISKDLYWMKKAFSEAEKGRGYVSPNPLVGCVIVNSAGKLIGKGYHERYGQAHAEVNAVTSVKNKESLSGATVYVTLEPCAHYGKTPPCAEMLAQLPVKRVVVGLIDPNPKVSGKGIQMLKNAGIEVEVGLLSDEIEKQNEFFLHFIKTGKPFVTLKWAQTMDGYVAAPDGSSQWISGKESQTLVHQWRSVYDAVMVGRQTARFDNPSLTVRHVQGRQPKRILLDGPGSSPSDLRLLTDQYEEKTIVITANPDFLKSSDPMLNLVSGKGFKGQRIFCNKKNGYVDLNQAFAQLGEMEISSVLVEAGPTLAVAMLKNRLADKLEIFIAPKILGGGKPALNGLDITSIENAMMLSKSEWKQIGQDLLFTAYL